MTHFAFYHGWAMGPEVFHPLAKALGGHGWFFDRGYRGSPSAPGPGPGNWTVITHSMGLWQVPFELLASCQTLVILAGFEAFIPTEPRWQPVVKRSLDRLQKGLSHNLELTLAGFAQSVGIAARRQVEPPNWQSCLLRQDLQRLATSTWGYAGQLPEVKLIHGLSDPIALPSQGERLAEKLKQPLKGLPQTGHGCKLDQPEFLKTLIQQPTL